MPRGFVIVDARLIDMIDDLRPATNVEAALVIKQAMFQHGELPAARKLARRLKWTHQRVARLVQYMQAEGMLNPTHKPPAGNPQVNLFRSTLYKGVQRLNTLLRPGAPPPKPQPEPMADHIYKQSKKSKTEQVMKKSFLKDEGKVGVAAEVKALSEDLYKLHPAGKDGVTQTFTFDDLPAFAVMQLRLTGKRGALERAAQQLCVDFPNAKTYTAEMQQTLALHLGYAQHLYDPKQQKTAPGEGGGG